MSNNTLFTKEPATVHVYMAIKRKKENPEITCKQERCYRQVAYDDDEAIRVLKAIIADKPGVYRIYKTVNARKTAVAKNTMLHWFVDGLYQNSSMNSVWTKALLQKNCRATKLALVDIDTNDESKMRDVTLKIGQWMQDGRDVNTEAEIIKTPNGWHMVCEAFDKRILDEFDYADVDYDRFVFVDRITVK